MITIATNHTSQSHMQIWLIVGKIVQMTAMKGEQIQTDSARGGNTTVYVKVIPPLFK